MTTTGDVLLQAIVEDPEADDLRLIYADWLDDHGDSERAEFIRLEIAQAVLHPDSDLAPERWEQPEYYRIDARLEELRKDHSARWFGEVERLARMVVTARGFVEYADLGARQFAQRADEIFAAAPLLQRVYLDRIGKNMPDVVARPEFARLREIGFLETPLGAEGLSLVARSPNSCNLRAIYGMDNKIGPAAGVALGESPQLGQLRILDIPDNPFYDLGVQAVLLSSRLPELRELDFNNCGLSDRCAHAFFNSDGPPLRGLKLGRNHLSQYGLRVLAQAPRLASLERLNLHSNNLHDGAAELATSRHFRNLRELHLGSTHSTDNALAALLRSEVMCTVETLSLGGNSFGSQAIAALDFATLARLRKLHLAKCDLGASALPQVARLVTTDLEELDLSHNHLSSGLGWLLATPLLRGVRKLRLSGCGLTDDDAEMLAGSELLTGLRVLDLDENTIRSRGGLALARSPHLANLGHLYLRRNPLGKRARKALLDRFGDAACRV